MKNNILEQINFAHPGITELYESLLEMKFPLSFNRLQSLNHSGSEKSKENNFSLVAECTLAFQRARSQINTLNTSGKKVLLFLPSLILSVS